MNKQPKTNFMLLKKLLGKCRKNRCKVITNSYKSYVSAAYKGVSCSMQQHVNRSVLTNPRVEFY